MHGFSSRPHSRMLQGALDSGSFPKVLCLKITNEGGITYWNRTGPLFLGMFSKCQARPWCWQCGLPPAWPVGPQHLHLSCLSPGGGRRPPSQGLPLIPLRQVVLFTTAFSSAHHPDVHIPTTVCGDHCTWPSLWSPPGRELLGRGTLSTLCLHRGLCDLGVA